MLGLGLKTTIGSGGRGHPPFNPLLEVGTDILRWFDGTKGVTHASNGSRNLRI